MADEPTPAADAPAEETRFAPPQGADLEVAPAVNYQLPEEWALGQPDGGWPDPLYRLPDLAALEALRRPFDPKYVEKLPKGVKDKQASPENCEVCGGYHSPVFFHLDYVGHAAVTDRLLSVDPLWWWEPFALDPITALPLMDYDGQNRPIGMWIKLHVAGRTIIGYGSSDPKPDAVKEIIGDALRNAAMRLGVALTLWKKGELESIADNPQALDASTGAVRQQRNDAGEPVVTKAQREELVAMFDELPAGAVRNQAKIDWLAHFEVDKPMKLAASRFDEAKLWIADRVAADLAATEEPSAPPDDLEREAKAEPADPELGEDDPAAPAPADDFPVPDGETTWPGELPAVPGTGETLYKPSDYIAGLVEYADGLTDEHAATFDGWLADRGWQGIEWEKYPQWALKSAFDKLSAIVEGTDNQEATDG